MTIVNKIIKKIKQEKSTPLAEDFAKFTENLFSGVSGKILQQMGEDGIYARAITSWEFFCHYESYDKPKVRVFTPAESENGWNSYKTIIETINTDKPFLVDSLVSEMSRLGFRTHLLLHPTYEVLRDSDGNLRKISFPKPEEQDSKKSKLESFIRFELTPLPDDMHPDMVASAVQRVLEAVEYSVRDWKKIVSNAEDMINEYQNLTEKQTKNLCNNEQLEAIEFMKWLVDNHYIFLGSIDIDFYDHKGKKSQKPVPRSAYGVYLLEDGSFEPTAYEDKLSDKTEYFLNQPNLIEVTKSSHKSIVHRPVHMDFVTAKRFNSNGKVIGERRFLGLFTSIVYYQSASRIPMLRRKIDVVRDKAAYLPQSHNAKALTSILEFFPRDEMFQISNDKLFEISKGILDLEERPRVGLFVREDNFKRFVSCLIYVPKEQFNTQIRLKYQEILQDAFEGNTVALYTQMTDSPLARIHIIIAVKDGVVPEVNIEAIKEQLAEEAMLWEDSLHNELLLRYGEKHGERMFRLYRKAFPKSYPNHYKANTAIGDIVKIEEALYSRNLSLKISAGSDDDSKRPYRFDLKIYNAHKQVPLSDIVPMLENMGVRIIGENPFLIKPLGIEDGVWMRDFHLTNKEEEEIDINEFKDKFEECLTKIWYGEIENDGFNRLVMAAKLDWRKIVLLRAYSKYLRQAKFTYSQNYIEDSLVAHPDTTTALVEYFYAKFDPSGDKNRIKNIEKAEKKFLELVNQISNVDEDIIFNRLFAVIKATLRTNYFQKNTLDEYKNYISFKFNSEQIPELPLPHPFAEIFVYSRKMEGIHLRGGKVARGGLRWSDRREDFRTEVLGLMKAQMVKNTVIIPEGSKGGFVVKEMPKTNDRDKIYEAGVASYRIFLQGLLDITDNVVTGNIVPPEQVVRYDSDDPYLVVAADKGTATFSDFANEESEGYGFWLGDAFASGGSAGYDHKKMGITARGAWVSVQRHFMEMDIDIQNTDFTVVGIGDMGGDVFGNGMLLSKHIKLIAAFNHLHIFIDPDPDPAKSWQERKRLFELPRSSWTDYDRELISKGGGIYERSAKSIALSPEACDMLAISTNNVTPNQLISAILKAPADLLWNGGIGTYVKCSDEDHNDVGDRANDALRVDGDELRVKVIGEGGNLGLTQLGRIEYAKNGGRINSDAIDNSAGVGCSDREVNIKIAVGAAEKEGVLSRKDRDKLLVDMTDEVSSLVLRDNRLQTQALSIAEFHGYFALEPNVRLMRMMEREGFLDRNIEFLPDDEHIEELTSKKQPLTRPELSVLLAYSKLHLYRQILESNIPDEEYFSGDLKLYFPSLMRDKYDNYIEDHQLRREIVATALTNSIVNRVGSTFFNQIAEETGMKACDIARGYTITRDSFGLRELWKGIEDLDGKIASSSQMKLFCDINQFISRLTLWFLRNCPQPLDIAKQVSRFKPAIDELKSNLEYIHSQATLEFYNRKMAEYQQLRVPEELAHNIASLDILSSAPNIVRVAQNSRQSLFTVGRVYFQLGTVLHLSWLRQSAMQLDARSHWERLGVSSIIQELVDQQRRLTAEVILNICNDEQCEIAVSNWSEIHKPVLDRYESFIEDLRTNDKLDFAMLTIALRRVEAIASNED